MRFLLYRRKMGILPQKEELAMRQTNGNAATQSNRTAIGFEPESMIRYWQHSAVRMVRANERMFQGLIAATTLEMRLSQILIRYQLAVMQPRPNGFNADDFSGNPARENTGETDQLIAGFGEISRELWNSVGEATRLLFADEEIKFRDCAVTPAPREFRDERLGPKGP